MTPLFSLILAVNLTGDVRQPQIAASGEHVWLTYGSGSAIFVTQSADGARTFSPPVKAAEPGRLGLGHHRGPRIVAVAGGALVAAGVGADILAWRSSDGGRTWSAGARVNDVASAAPEGFVALASDGAQRVWAVWLDLRVKGMRLYGADSKDGGATWAGKRMIYESPDGHICECCHPSVLLTADSSVVVMWRNWLNGARDMWMAVSKDGTRFDAQKLGEGSWPLNACPMDGGGIAASGSKLVSAWRRDKSIFLASPGAREEPVGEGKNPAVAIGSKGAYVVWQALDGLRIRRPGAAPEMLAPEGAFPVMAGSGPVYAAWEEKGRIVVQKVD